MKSLLVIAGEISGDLHAAALVQAARRRHPDLQVYGIGGDRLADAGMEILHHTREMAVLGLAEVLRRYGFFKKVFDEMVRVAEARRPDAVLLVDYPGFNLRFARALRGRGIKVLYYVCPQVWAWHRSRIPAMASLIDRLMVIFPFEVEVFAGTGLRVDFVGHPLVDDARRSLQEPEAELPWRGPRRVALLPGSRRQEIVRILPDLLAAAALLEERNPTTCFLIAAASPELAELIRRVLAETARKPARCEVVVNATRQVLRQARAAMVASGTATLETALMNCPMIVAYRTVWLTYAIGRLLVRVPHLGMVNLIAGREICPEFIQVAHPGPAMAAALEKLLADSPERQACLDGLAEVRERLGQGGAAERAAAIVLEELAGAD